MNKRSIIRNRMQVAIEKLLPPKDGMLVFHDVVDNLENSNYPEFAITKDDFIIFISALIEGGKRFVNIESLDKNDALCITFDDGDITFKKNVFPVLANNNIASTVFLVNSWIGEDGFMSFDDICELDKTGLIEWGGHTLHHALLSECDRERLDEELVYSKEELEMMLERKINYFAYPYGSFNAVSREAIGKIKTLGYRMAFSTVAANRHFFHNRLFYPRTTVTSLNYRYVLGEMGMDVE